METQCFAPVGVVHAGSVVIDRTAVDESFLYPPVEGASFQRAPAAFAEDAVMRQLPAFGADEDEVGPVAFADEAPAFDAEQAGGVVAHLFYQCFRRQDAFLHQLQHADQRELHHRHARGGPQGAAGFLGQQVGGVVGGDDVDAAGADGLAQGIAVCLPLDGGVALDAGGQHLVVLHFEQQVCHAGFGRYPLVLVQGRVAEEGQFPGRGDVQHVQACPGFRGQLYGQPRGGVAGLYAADVGVFVDRYLGILQEFGLVFFRILPYGLLVFAVGGDEHVRTVEDAPQAVHAVHQHIACAGAHEEFDAADACLVQLGEEPVIVVRRAEVARVVHHAFLRQQRLFLLQGFEGRGGRVGVGHVHDGGHSACGGGAALAEDVRLVRQAGVAEVHVVVDDAGQQEAACGVDGLVARG